VCQVDQSNHIKMHTARLISEWIKWLANHNCFCPEDSNRPLDTFSNIKCYISSPADQDGRVTCDSNMRTILRFFNSDGGKQCVEHAVAELIYSAFGGELKQYCHVSNEPCIIKNLVKSVAGMEVDLRILMDSSPIYCTRKHILKLGLQSVLGGLANSMVTEPDKFMKVFQWKTQGNTVASQGMGINMWSLLTLASLAGSDDIHCKTRDKAAQNILSLILKMAPAGATPCNTVCVRSFHKSTTEPQCVFVTGERRCHHFLRPIYDLNFALTGNFSLCAHVNDKMPEDYLHCSALLALSNFLSCEIWEIPPEQVTCRYSLMPDIHYCVYSHSNNVTGDLILLDDAVFFETETGQYESLDVNHWERELRQLGFIVLPCLFRSGALVRYKDDDGVELLGCPVPDGCFEAMGRPSGNSDYVNVTNYDHENKCYHLRISPEEIVRIHAIPLFQNLVVPGTFLWIKGGSETFEKLKGNFPDSLNGVQNIDQCMIRVRLNVPNIVNPQPGVIYVTYLVKNRDAFAPKLSKSYDHGVAMPWELSLEGPKEPLLQITELYI
jgi:hypothetical protein